MDWLHSDDAMWDRNMSIMDFIPTKSKVLVVAKQARGRMGINTRASDPLKDLEQTKLRAQEHTLHSDEEWQDWLNCVGPMTEQWKAHLTLSKHSHQPDTRFTSKIRLILGGRADSEDFDPDVLSYLPFSEPLFRRLIKEFKIHGTIARTINRNTSSAFIRKFHSWDSADDRSIVYNCRSTASWQGDLGLSATFTPQTLTTHAVMYGCDDQTAKGVISRLSATDLPELHPMILVVLFAELERDRLDKLIRNKTSQLIQYIVRITEKSNYTLENGDSSTISPTLTESIKDWLKMGELRNGLQTFKRKMQDMMDHVDELQILFDPENDKHNLASTMNPDVLCSLRDTGDKIKERLKHLVDEFDEHIRRCATIIDGVGLASQLEWNQIGRKDTFTNLEIAHNGLKVAQHARRDSELMKSIALLTVIFLPATFVATLFSMGIFEWKGMNGEVLSVSPYIWLYIVVTVVVTSVTLGVWYVWVMRTRVIGEDTESQLGRVDEK